MKAVCVVCQWTTALCSSVPSEPTSVTTIAQYLVVLPSYDSWCLQWVSLDFVCCFSSLAHWQLQSFTWILWILHFYPLWAPRALHLWFWWTALNQRTVEGSHALNLRALCGGLCDEPSSVRGWVDVSYSRESMAALKTGPLNEPRKHMTCVPEVSVLESMESWNNITPAAIQSENYVSCAWL